MSLAIAILGEGIWGRAVGKLAGDLGHRIHFVHHLESSLGSGPTDLLMIALPVQHVRETLERIKAPGVPILNLSKGLEIASGSRVSQIVREVWREERVGTLSGPTFAAEIMRGLPATCVVAAAHDGLARQFQTVLHQPNFRIYRSTDIVGVEWAGALKNVYAIAGGVCAGLKLGENSLAGLLTRCVAEMTRIGVEAGDRPETFTGLSGMGDLILTAMSAQSRNHQVGRLLAAGKSLDVILTELSGVAEGVPTTKSAFVNTAIPVDAKPIITQIYALLYQNKPIAAAIRDLLGRAARVEDASGEDGLHQRPENAK